MGGNMTELDSPILPAYIAYTRNPYIALHHFSAVISKIPFVCLSVRPQVRQTSVCPSEGCKR